MPLFMPSMSFVRIFYGRRFTVLTDHRPLEWLMSKNEPSGRLARWALKLQEYDIEIGYRSGKSNQNADGLSRTPIPETTPVVAVVSFATSETWEKAQRLDGFCAQIIKEILNSPSNQYNGYELSSNNELIDIEGRLVVPQSKVKEVLELSHDHLLSGHLGISRTIARVLRQYTWPTVRHDVEQYVKTCIHCVRRKSHGASTAPLHPLQPANHIWERIAMDVVGPVPESIKGHKYILVVADYATRYVITIPMVDQKASTIASHFANKIISRYGAPESVLTDRGTNFLSQFVSNLCKLFQIKQMRTTAYHPQTDGLVERFNRTLCDMLACYVTETPEEWDVYLPFVTLAYNTSKQDSLQNNPFYLFYGRDAVLPTDTTVLKENGQSTLDDDSYKYRWCRALELARNNLLRAQLHQKKYYDRPNGQNPIEYQVGQMVLLRAATSTGKFALRWDGPYVINRKISDLTYEIVTKSGQSFSSSAKIVHVNRLKPFLNPSFATLPPTTKPLRAAGRPRKDRHRGIVGPRFDIVKPSIRRGRKPSQKVLPSRSYSSRRRSCISSPIRQKPIIPTPPSSLREPFVSHPTPYQTRSRSLHPNDDSLRPYNLRRRDRS